MPSLGNDLALIRKSQGFTIEEIHKSTKIPVKVLASIEDDSIFNQSGNNVIYVRSYVRSYAKALSIEEHKIVNALNRVNNNNYGGGLISEKQRAQLEESASKQEDGKQEKPDNSDDSSQQEDDLFAEPEDTQPTGKESPALSSDDVDWVDLGYQFQPAKTLKSNNHFTTIATVILVAIAAFLAYWFYFRGPNETNLTPEQSEEIPQTTTSADSLETGLTPSASNDTADLTDLSTPSQAEQALSDTLSIVLYAAYDKLEPVRVYTDILDELNPYWIERGEAIEFKFVNNFHVRDGLSDIVLLMNGHVIPNFQEQFLNPEAGRIEINRSFFQGDSKWLQPPPDTLPIQAPPPSVIHTLDN